MPLSELFSLLPWRLYNVNGWRVSTVKAMPVCVLGGGACVCERALIGGWGGGGGVVRVGLMCILSCPTEHQLHGLWRFS